MDCVIHNPRGNGGVKVSGIGVLANGQTVERQISAELYRALDRQSGLAVAKKGSEGAAALLEAGAVEEARRRENREVRASHRAAVAGKRRGKASAGAEPAPEAKERGKKK